MLKEYLSTYQVSKILGISRIAVFKKIQKGYLKAEKVGRSYIIKTDILKEYVLKEKEKKENKILEKKAIMDKVVNKVVEEYGETLRLLSQ